MNRIPEYLSSYKPLKWKIKKPTQLVPVRKANGSSKLSTIHKSLFRSYNDSAKNQLKSTSVTDMDCEFSYKRASESFERIMDIERHRPSVQNIPQYIAPKVNIMLGQSPHREVPGRLPKLVFANSTLKTSTLRVEGLNRNQNKTPDLFASNMLSKSFVLKGSKKPSKLYSVRGKSERKTYKYKSFKEVNPWKFDSKDACIFELKKDYYNCNT